MLTHAWHVHSNVASELDQIMNENKGYEQAIDRLLILTSL
jgi:hypothetical protein